MWTPRNESEEINLDIHLPLHCVQILPLQGVKKKTTGWQAKILYLKVLTTIEVALVFAIGHEI